MCWYPTLYNSKLYKYLYTVTIQLYSHTVYDKLNSDVPGQNGIWAKFNISDLKMMMKSSLGKIFFLKGSYPIVFVSNVFHNFHLIQKCIQNQQQLLILYTLLNQMRFVKNI